MLSSEDILPYDRTLLSKVLPTGDATKFLLRSDEFYKSADIDYKLSVTATKVDTKNRKITLSNGEVVEYDKLCVATGGRPKVPTNIKGIDLQNVHLLRNHQD